jgi:hypothetical protein
MRIIVVCSDPRFQDPDDDARNQRITWMHNFIKFIFPHLIVNAYAVNHVGEVLSIPVEKPLAWDFGFWLSARYWWVRWKLNWF